MTIDTSMSVASSSKPSTLWVFGYGSLIWNPGFEHNGTLKAYAYGYSRRMYQGNTFHRGDDVLPGRVATLVKDHKGITSGVVFKVVGKTKIDECIQHLQEREVGNGYEFQLIRVKVENQEIIALTCIAFEGNEFFLGAARIDRMAEQISTAKGKAGPNHEYVLKLAENIRALFPDEDEPHLFGLERRVRDFLRIAA